MPPRNSTPTDAGLRLDLEYDVAGSLRLGGPAGARTVGEGKLREALATLRAGVEVAVAGRTDAGCTSRGERRHRQRPRAAAHPRRPRRPAAAGRVRRRPRCGPGFDARRDARSRRYEYRVLPGPPSALRRARVLHHPAPLDRRRWPTRPGAAGRHDFRAFTPTRTEHVFFDPHGDGLRLGAARRRAGADRGGRRLPAPHGARPRRGPPPGGRGAWPVSRFEAPPGAPRGAVGPTAPPHALTLTGVRYGDGSVSSGARNLGPGS